MKAAKGSKIAVSDGSTALHLASMMVCLTTRAVKATEVSMSSSLCVLLLMRCLCGSAWAMYQHVQNSYQYLMVQQSLLSKNIATIPHHLADECQNKLSVIAHVGAVVIT